LLLLIVVVVRVVLVLEITTIQIVLVVVVVVVVLLVVGIAVDIVFFMIININIYNLHLIVRVISPLDHQLLFIVVISHCLSFVYHPMHCSVVSFRRWHTFYELLSHIKPTVITFLFIILHIEESQNCFTRFLG